MKLPKRPTGVRYLGATDYNKRVTFFNPNAGSAEDGTPNAPVCVKTVWASVSQWRGKEKDQQQTRVGQSSYKISIRYPKGWAIDTGMTINVGTQLHNIESMSDPDGQKVQLDLWTFVDNATAGCE